MSTSLLEGIRENASLVDEGTENYYMLENHSCTSTMFLCWRAMASVYLVACNSFTVVFTHRTVHAWTCISVKVCWFHSLTATLSFSPTCVYSLRFGFLYTSHEKSCESVCINEHRIFLSIRSIGSSSITSVMFFTAHMFHLTKINL